MLCSAARPVLFGYDLPEGGTSVISEMSGSHILLSYIYCAPTPPNIHTSDIPSFRPLRSPFPNIPTPSSQHLDDLRSHSNRNRHPDEDETFMYGVRQRQLRPDA